MVYSLIVISGEMQSLYDFCFEREEQTAVYRLYLAAAVLSSFSKLAIELAATLCIVAMGFVCTVLIAAGSWTVFSNLL